MVRSSVLSAKRSRSAAAGSKISWKRVKEGIVILTPKCPVCGKIREEIEKKWREEG